MGTKMISEKQQSILDFLEGKDWVSPTFIGIEVANKSYTSASAWVKPIADILIRKGLIVRNSRGKLRKININNLNVLDNGDIITTVRPLTKN